MRVAIYVQVSTADQTTDNQRFELERYAAARGWTVVATFTDVISGSTTSRPELDRMLRSARRRNFDLVLIWKLDRLGRSLAHLVTLAEELQQIGVALVSLGENIDGSTTTGRLMLGVMASLAQFEKERLVERVRAGLSRAKRQGKVLSADPTEWGSQRRRGHKSQGSQAVRLRPSSAARNRRPHACCSRLSQKTATTAA
jgi:DNA invertase Pin-like site-specific DNA recombinase